jgi:two-component system, LuxR family, response regulator FixJ
VNRWGCVLVDVRVPGMSGFELQQRLGERLSTLGIVFMSGHGDLEMTTRALEAGAVAFLLKPFEDKVLLGAVQEAFRRSSEACRRQTMDVTGGVTASVTEVAPVPVGRDGRVVNQ